MSVVASTSCCCGNDLPTCVEMFLACPCHQRVQISVTCEQEWALWRDARAFMGFRPGGVPCTNPNPPFTCPCPPGPPRQVAHGFWRWTMGGIANRVIGNCGNGFAAGGQQVEWDAVVSATFWNANRYECSDLNAADDCEPTRCNDRTYTMNGEGTGGVMEIGCQLHDCAGTGTAVPAYWLQARTAEQHPVMLQGNGTVEWPDGEVLSAPVRGALHMQADAYKTWACGDSHRCPTGAYGGCSQHPALMQCGAAWGAAICERCGEQEQEWVPLHGLYGPRLGRYQGSSSTQPNYCRQVLASQHTWQWPLVSDGYEFGHHIVGTKRMYVSVTEAP